MTNGLGCRLNEPLRRVRWSMRLSLLASALVVAGVTLCSQSSETVIKGVDEPLELIGPPKPVNSPQLSDAEKELLPTVTQSLDPTNPTKLKVARDALTSLIQREPDYSDGYAMRAIARCYIGETDLKPILDDVELAISVHSTSTRPSAYKTAADLYVLWAKIEVDAGQHQSALAHLDEALKQDYDPSNFFGSGTVEPVASTARCEWTKLDLDDLVRRFPTDFRVNLYRGLYLMYFERLKPEYYAAALQDLTASQRLNPKSPLPPLFIGQLMTREGGLLSKELGQCLGPETPVPCGVLDDRNRRAVASLSTALVNDPRCAQALALRANAYYELKDFRHALSDFDRLLEIEPDNRSAYNDRGLARAALGNYGGAVSDYTSALEHSKLDDTNGIYISNSYDNRADAYLKIGDRPDAVADITSSVKASMAPVVCATSLKEFRTVYPEYDRTPDEALLHKLYAMFCSQYPYDMFVGMLQDGNRLGAMWILADRFDLRGDAYLRLLDFKDRKSV